MQCMQESLFFLYLPYEDEMTYPILLTVIAMRETMKQRQELTSPHITRAPSVTTSNTTMEVVTDSCRRFEEDKKLDKGNNSCGWGPPIVNRKDNAWEEGTAHIPPTSRIALQHKTEKWVENSTPAARPKVDKTHPVSADTQDFLASMVTTMRDGVNSNTGVMALLNKPVSIFEEPDTRDLDLSEQDKINQELEDFLRQIKEIRDGPTQQIVEGELAEEMTSHLTEQKEAVEQALAVLDRELTQDSGVNGSEAEHEDEFKRLVLEREETYTSEMSVVSALSASNTQVSGLSRSDSQITVTTQLTEYAASEHANPPPLIPKKMTLYELLNLHPDPKVRKAALKMKRLDEQLRLVIQREKEVKKQHELLNKQLLLYTTGSGLVNTQQQQHQQLDTDEGDELTHITDLKSDITPIFATQFGDDESETCSLPPLSARGSLTSQKKKKNSSSSSTTSPGSRQSRDTQGGGKQSRDHRGTKSRSTAQSKQSNFSRREDKKQGNNKNFIARNKELANDASAAVAMTEEEKQRLQELLNDVDELDEAQPNTTVAVLSDGGFRASLAEEKRLQEINTLLIVEEGSSMSLCSGQTNTTTLSFESKVISELNERCPLEAGAQLGESALKKLTKNRSEQERITLIDEMLSKFSNEEEAPEVPRSVLEELLTQCRAETAKQEPEHEPEQPLTVL